MKLVELKLSRSPVHFIWNQYSITLPSISCRIVSKYCLQFLSPSIVSSYCLQVLSPSIGLQVLSPSIISKQVSKLQFHSLKSSLASYSTSIHFLTSRSILGSSRWYPTICHNQKPVFCTLNTLYCKLKRSQKCYECYVSFIVLMSISGKRK